MRYGFFATILRFASDFPHVIEGWLKLRENKTDKYPVWDFLRSHNKWWTVLEIIGAFLLTEWLRAFTQGNSQLETVDLRLLFVVIVGTIYGCMPACSQPYWPAPAWPCPTRRRARPFALLFYDTSNWLAFVIYFRGRIGMRLRAVAQPGEREVRARRERVVAQSSGLPARAVSKDVLDDRRQLLATRSSADATVSASCTP